MEEAVVFGAIDISHSNSVKICMRIVLVAIWEILVQDCFGSWIEARRAQVVTIRI